MRQGTLAPPITAQQAIDARLKNIIELGLDFSAMTRVFAEGSYATIAERLENFVSDLKCVGGKEEYEQLHAEFCRCFTERICTAGKQFKNGMSRPSCACSYGQAAKVLDVAAKVYVYYCGLPNAEIANRLIPLLHAALDTKMMLHLGVNASLYEIDRRAYADLQDRVVHAIGDSDILPRAVRRRDLAAPEQIAREAVAPRAFVSAGGPVVPTGAAGATWATEARTVARCGLP